jgi:hypothetical protein
MKKLSDQNQNQNENTVSKSDLMLTLSWQMGLVDTSVAVLRFGSIIDNSIQFLKYQMVWEVYFVSGSATGPIRTLQASRILLPGSCLPCGKWTQCAATVPYPPMNSSIEIRIVFVHNDLYTPAFRTNENGSNFSVRGFNLEIFPSIEHFAGQDQSRVCGGDCTQWSEHLNECLTSDCLNKRSKSYELSALGYATPCDSAHGIGDSYYVARSFTWIGPSCDSAKLVWESKLSSNFMFDMNVLDGELADHTPWNVTEGVTMSYAWCILRCRHLGDNITDRENVRYSVITKGELNTLSNTRNVDDGAVKQVLGPWMWTKVEALVPSLLMNDSIKLCFKVISNPSRTDINAKCLVTSKLCSILLPVESYLGKEDIFYCSDSLSSSALVTPIFNCASISSCV